MVRYNDNDDINNDNENNNDNYDNDMLEHKILLTQPYSRSEH